MDELSDTSSLDSSTEDVGGLLLEQDKEMFSKNYKVAGTVMEEEDDEISLANNDHLLSDQVHTALQEVLSELRLPFELSDFQKLSVHVLGSGQNLVLISPTGSGKMYVVWVGSLVMRKIFNCPTGVTIGTQPLSLIMEEKLSNSPVPTGVINMAGGMRHNLEEEGPGEDIVLSDPETDFLDGKLPVIIGHPESWGSLKGQELARKMHRRKMIQMLFIDEFHQGLPGHWSSIRPEMMQVAGQLRIFGVQGAPTVAMTATATEKEVKDIIATLGLKQPPVILRASPVQEHTKYIVLKRPPNSCGSHGREDKHGNHQPGILQLLDDIYLDQYVSAVKAGLSVKKAIIFCRTEKHMLHIFEHCKE